MVKSVSLQAAAKILAGSKVKGQGVRRQRRLCYHSTPVEAGTSGNPEQGQDA